MNWKKDAFTKQISKIKIWVIRKIKKTRITLPTRFEELIQQLGYNFEKIARFDTIEVYCKEAPKIHQLSLEKGINLRILPLGSRSNEATGFGVSFDELTRSSSVLSNSSSSKGSPANWAANSLAKRSGSMAKLANPSLLNFWFSLFIALTEEEQT